ncbi:altronate dehydratase [Geomicrobium halophilum]|uniref:Altronate dehydratase n=1 Tax=Geomicrobium halophilum TaxID=549000 RepID=A0A841PIQ7_9BACL|nr:UxaA family hydrolase [Geomicrobium halophilum]MBB6448619.1 altronate dehydratase [Geomicrobium halophilum]
MTYTFEGYQRSDGTVGTRNHVGIVSSVICSSVVVREIAEHVPLAIPFVHANGCAQLGDDFQLTKNILVGVTKNPNLYGSLIVGLGCETNQVSGMLKSIPKTKPTKGIAIQELFGGKNTISEGVKAAEQWAEEAASETRKTYPLSAINVGIMTVDPDESSLHQTAPVIGKVVDRLIDNDVNVIMGMSKTLEPAGQILSKRAPNPKVKQDLHTLSEGMRRGRWEKVQDKTTGLHEWSEEETDLANLEARLTGTKSIDGLLDYGSYPEEQGLNLMRVPSNIVEALSGLASAGCAVVLMVSSRGVFTGSVALPSMTVAPQIEGDFEDELVDVAVTNNDADQQADQVVQKIIDICSGQESKLEELELGEFSISHSGTTY